MLFVTTWYCVGLSKEGSSDAKEVVSPFYFSNGSRWSMFDINKINVLRPNPHGKSSSTKSSEKAYQCRAR